MAMMVRPVIPFLLTRVLSSRGNSSASSTISVSSMGIAMILTLHPAQQDLLLVVFKAFQVLLPGLTWLLLDQFLQRTDETQGDDVAGQVRPAHIRLLDSFGQRGQEDRAGIGLGFLLQAAGFGIPFCNGLGSPLLPEGTPG